jgi:hypothetical protein
VFLIARCKDQQVTFRAAHHQRAIDNAEIKDRLTDCQVMYDVPGARLHLQTKEA